jgi:hypothetical protein
METTARHTNDSYTQDTQTTAKQASFSSGLFIYGWRRARLTFQQDMALIEALYQLHMYVCMYAGYDCSVSVHFYRP